MRRALPAILALALATCALAVDWPQFRGPNRDGRTEETGLLKQWPDGGPKLLWKVEGLGKGYSHPVIVGDQAYVAGVIGDKGYCSRIDADGKLVWKKPYGKGWSTRYPGSRSIPTIHKGRVYLTTGHGRIVCLQVLDGGEVWSRDLLGDFGARNVRWGFAESVLIDGDNVIVTPGGRKAVMAALNARTGKTVWTTPGIGDGSGYCSPILLKRGPTRLIVTMTDRNIIGVDADSGKLLWKSPHRNRHGNHCVSPIYSDGMLYVTSGYGKGGEMLKLSADGKSVRQAWEEQRPDCHHGGMVLVDGRLHGTGHKNGGKWVCVELASGKVLWEERGIGKGSVVYADGMLYGYSERGTVALIKPSAKGFEQVSSFKVTEGSGQHWAHPVVSNGRLYIRHGDVMMCYDIKAK